MIVDKEVTVLPLPVTYVMATTIGHGSFTLRPKVEPGHQILSAS